MVESRTFYITRRDDDQSETGTPAQGYLRRRAKKAAGRKTDHPRISKGTFLRHRILGKTKPNPCRTHGAGQSVGQIGPMLTDVFRELESTPGTGGNTSRQSCGFEVRSENALPEERTFDPNTLFLRKKKHRPKGVTARRKAAGSKYRRVS